MSNAEKIVVGMILIKFKIITRLFCWYCLYFDYRSMPDPLAYTSYVFSFHNIMCGPLVFYSDYIRFIEGTDGSYDTQVHCMTTFIFLE